MQLTLPPDEYVPGLHAVEELDVVDGHSNPAGHIVHSV